MALLQKAYLGSTALFRINPWWLDTDATLVDFKNATDITASATAHTKGAYTELIASTSSDINFIEFNATNLASSGNNTATLIDIAVGAAGSETNIAENIAVGGAGGLGNQINIQIPVLIPSGSRISARSQAVIGSDIVRIGGFIGYNMDADGVPTSVDTLGTDTATSEGTALSSTNGAWQEIVSSTTQAYTGICIVPSSSDAAQNNSFETRYEVAVGAAGSEVAFGAIMVGFSANETASSRSQTVLFGRDIPSGSRLSVRHNINSGGDKFDVCLIAIPKV